MDGTCCRAAYCARFDTDAAPPWLRVLYRTPFLDRFAYPLMVRPGYGYLQPFPDADATDLAPFPGGGWRPEEPDHAQPSSVSWLRPDGDAG